MWSYVALAFRIPPNGRRHQPGLDSPSGVTTEDLDEKAKEVQHRSRSLVEYASSLVVPGKRTKR